MRKPIVAVLAALAVSALAAPASAAADNEVSVTVPYSDLDLADPAGSATLSNRIEAAVAQVCAKPHIRDLKSMLAWEHCKAEARVGAMEQISVLEPYESMALASLF